MYILLQAKLSVLTIPGSLRLKRHAVLVIQTVCCHISSIAVDSGHSKISIMHAWSTIDLPSECTDL